MNDNDCSWCGAELGDVVKRDVRGQKFCSRGHRDASSRAVRRLLDSVPDPHFAKALAAEGGAK